MQNVSEFYNIIAQKDKISLHKKVLIIDTMKFESSLLASFLDSDVDNEVVAINVQIETVMLLKIFVYFQHQINEIRCLNHCHGHRHWPCQKRRKFLHDCAKNTIWNDYLKPNPLLEKVFLLMFYISCGRFDKLMQDVMGKSIPFFSDIFGRKRKSPAFLKAHLLMSIKTLAYGLPTHTLLN